ncbi:MAG: methylenetetrahydrofolate--tRNA-(uracil(54)-C(5))-methyltransferase (FADH(2)-oxidizing) TrmFO [candidate division NC10 bacterium]|nr:methylenetetrahydrofolate--tRNA-(uracil(54)-C(5))-methyltransferase (FADH(2)-oxidizing) TrmFO [candidate division NC10 bacterium]
MAPVTIVGGGLSGAEAAWQAAQAGAPVRLYEMRPTVRTPAHQTAHLAELVCSNSLKSLETTTASGLLNAELGRLDSLILEVAKRHAVPAGTALAVDREAFAAEVTARLAAHPGITIVREEVKALPPERPCIVATGPLTSDALAEDLCALFAAFLGEAEARPGLTPAAAPRARLFFYDAISPIVAADSVDRTVAFGASRYGKGGEDYLNCPLSEAEYTAFWEGLRTAETYPLHAFEETPFFEGCLPIEELARRGKDALCFGPMRPVGLRDPRTGRLPHAVVQLRREDVAGALWGLVGFQTRMRRGEQQRVFRMIPGLAQAEFLRYGSIHRNTYIASPLLLLSTLQFRGDPGLLFAGQLIGVEGYMESVGAGLLAGLNAARLIQGKPPVVPPPESLLGAILRYVTEGAPPDFAPMNVNFGLLPPLPRPVRNRRRRSEALAERALGALEAWRRFLG